MTKKYPENFSEGLRKYCEFHQLEPNRVQNSQLRIPTSLCHIGSTTWTFYESNKWENKAHAYKHEHDAGVNVYVPRNSKATPKGDVQECPDELRDSNLVLIRLGYSLGFKYIDLDGDERDVITSRPFPSLYCTPSGHILLVIQGKRTLIAAFWGGHLRVTARGIVG